MNSYLSRSERKNSNIKIQRKGRGAGLCCAMLCYPITSPRGGENLTLSVVQGDYVGGCHVTLEARDELLPAIGEQERGYLIYPERIPP